MTNDERIPVKQSVKSTTCLTKLNLQCFISQRSSFTSKHLTIDVTFLSSHSLSIFAHSPEFV